MHHYQPRGGDRILFAGTAKYLIRERAKERAVNEKNEPDGWLVNVMAIGFEVAIVYGFWLTVSWLFGIQ